MPELAELLAFLEEGEEATAAIGESVSAPAAASSEGVAVEAPKETGKTSKSTTKKAARALDDMTKQIPSLSDVPVPSGGVGLLLLITLIIVFAILKAPGHDESRLSLIFKSIMGLVVLPDDGAPANNAPTPGQKGAVLGGLPILIEGGIY